MNLVDTDEACVRNSQPLNRPIIQENTVCLDRCKKTEGGTRAGRPLIQMRQSWCSQNEPARKSLYTLRTFSVAQDNQDSIRRAAIVDPEIELLSGSLKSSGTCFMTIKQSFFAGRDTGLGHLMFGTLGGCSMLL